MRDPAVIKIKGINYQSEQLEICKIRTMYDKSCQGCIYYDRCKDTTFLKEVLYNGKSKI